MSAFKGTPGPWRVDGQTIIGADSVHTFGHQRNSLGISNASYSAHVCTVQGNACDPIDDLDPIAPRANAALIAQCPKLLQFALRHRDDPEAAEILAALRAEGAL